MEPFSFGPLQVGERQLCFDEPLLMGVVNVTPNSFSSGHTVDAAASIAHGVQLWRDGAAILDVGGEATNPKAAPVSAEEEWARIEPVLRGLAAATSAILSVDTTKAEVAARAVAAGATIVNDVSGGRFDAAMIDTVAELVRTHRVAYVASHLRGRSISEVFAAEPAGAGSPGAAVPEGAAELQGAKAPGGAADDATSSAGLPEATGSAGLPGAAGGPGAVGSSGSHGAASPKGAAGAVARPQPSKADVIAELVEQVAALPALVRAATIVDPGLGFGKGAGSLNLELMGAGGELGRATGRPVLIGPSRKRFLRRLLPENASALELDMATVGACLAAVRGGAQLLRIHAVALLRPALAVYIRK